jgi:dipeptidyl aminopeptidase/acylaminoacyl peptidase
MSKKLEHKVEDFLKTRYIDGINFSGDGSKIAFGISRVYKEFKAEEGKEIIVLSVKNGEQKLFSHVEWSNFVPKLSSTGMKLAYISKKEEEYRLFICDLPKGTEEEIVLHERAENLEWDGEDSVIISILDGDPKKEEKKEGRDGYFFEETPRFTSLWRYQLGSGFQRITKGVQVWEFNVNEGMVAAVTSALPYEWSWYEAELSVIDLKDFKIKKVYSRKNRQVAKPRLSPDNRRLIFLESLWSDRGVTSGDIIDLDLKSGKAENITRGESESFSEMQWKSGKEFYALSNKEGTFSISKFQGNRRKRLWSKYGAVHNPWSPSFSISGDVAAVSFESSKQPNELLLIDLKSKREKVLTNVNKHLENCKSYSSEKVKWRSYDGLEIYGIFRSAGKKTPLMVIIHGGPTSFSPDSFIGLSTLYLSKGYSVFLPNYRGSVGKGREYAEKNLGDMGGGDLQDILSGIDFLVKNNGIDRRNIFITGGSYGGFMSAWAITQTDIFKGAIALFGISDWISFHGVSNLPTWDRIHYDEDPYLFKRFLKFSPLWYVDKVKTPILLAHGIDDPYVPVGQFHQFYRALKDKGKDVRLLLFPREGHGFREKKHIEQYYEEVFKWLKARS